MNDTQEKSSLNLETFAERLESIESLLLALHTNAPYIECEPFEVSDDEDDETSAIETTSLARQLESYIDGLGLTYFKGRELTPFWTRRCRNVSNSVPPQNLWKNVAPTLVVLDKLRSDLGVPIIITSSYRSHDYNRCVGGVSNSQHLYFRAIDFVARGGTPDRWAAKLRSYRGRTFNVSGIGNYTFRGWVGVYSQGFVHLDTRG